MIGRMTSEFGDQVQVDESTFEWLELLKECYVATSASRLVEAFDQIRPSTLLELCRVFGVDRCSASAGAADDDMEAHTGSS